MEKELVIYKLRRKDPSVMDHLFDVYYERLYFFAVKYIYDSDEAHDIVQGVFERIWVRGSSIEFDVSVKSYLFGAVRNECMQYLRRLKVVDSNNRKWASAYVESLNLDAIDEEHHEVLEEVKGHISKLPPQCRAIFELRLMHGYKYSEIASKLEVSQNVVKVQMHRANKMMRTFLFSNHKTSNKELNVSFRKITTG